MNRKLTDIVIKQGWTHIVSGTDLVIKKDEPFDILTMMDTPTFVLPLTIHPTDYTVLVDPFNYKAYNTDLSISDVIEYE